MTRPSVICHSELVEESLPGAYGTMMVAGPLQSPVPLVPTASPATVLPAWAGAMEIEMLCEAVYFAMFWRCLSIFS